MKKNKISIDAEVLTVQLTKEQAEHLWAIRLSLRALVLAAGVGLFLLMGSLFFQ